MAPKGRLFKPMYDREDPVGGQSLLALLVYLVRDMRYDGKPAMKGRTRIATYQMKMDIWKITPIRRQSKK